MKLRCWKIKVQGWHLEPRMRKVKVRAARSITGYFLSRFQREDGGQDARAPHSGCVRSASAKEDFSNAIDFFIEAFQVTDRIL
jgi:hypothetical protein